MCPHVMPAPTRLDWRSFVLCCIICAVHDLRSALPAPQFTAPSYFEESSSCWNDLDACVPKKPSLTLQATWLWAETLPSNTKLPQVLIERSIPSERQAPLTVCGVRRLRQGGPLRAVFHAGRRAGVADRRAAPIGVAAAAHPRHRRLLLHGQGGMPCSRPCDVGCSRAEQRHRACKGQAVLCWHKPDAC